MRSQSKRPAASSATEAMRVAFISWKSPNWASAPARCSAACVSAFSSCVSALREVTWFVVTTYITVATSSAPSTPRHDVGAGAAGLAVAGTQLLGEKVDGPHAAAPSASPAATVWRKWFSCCSMPPVSSPPSGSERTTGRPIISPSS